MSAASTFSLSSGHASPSPSSALTPKWTSWSTTRTISPRTPNDSSCFRVCAPSSTELESVGDGLSVQASARALSSRHPGRTFVASALAVLAPNRTSGRRSGPGRRATPSDSSCSNVLTGRASTRARVGGGLLEGAEERGRSPSGQSQDSDVLGTAPPRVGGEPRYPADAGSMSARPPTGRRGAILEIRAPLPAPRRRKVAAKSSQSGGRREWCRGCGTAAGRPASG